MNVEKLLEVKAIILAEPLRVRMDDWASDEFESPLRPACDTVACLAGWTVAMGRIQTGACQFEDGVDILAGYCGDFAIDAQSILGLNAEQARRLFYVGLWPDEFKAPEHDYRSDRDGRIIRHYKAGDRPRHLSEFADWAVAGNLQPQTAAYAELVARRIDHFIATEGRE